MSPIDFWIVLKEESGRYLPASSTIYSAEEEAQSVAESIEGAFVVSLNRKALIYLANANGA